MTRLHAFQIQAEGVVHMNRESFEMGLISLYDYHIISMENLWKPEAFTAVSFGTC